MVFYSKFDVVGTLGVLHIGHFSKIIGLKINYVFTEIDFGYFTVMEKITIL